MSTIFTPGPNQVGSSGVTDDTGRMVWSWGREVQNRLDILTDLAQVAQDAAYGDSNDDEIDALRDALEYAMSLWGLDLPEGREES